MFRTFGANPSGAHLAQLRQSPHFRDGSFHNLEETPVLLPDTSYVKLLGEWLKRRPETLPPGPLPSLRPNFAALPSDGPALLWFGHSSYYLQHRGFRLLVDPVLSGWAAPFNFGAKAFPGADVVAPADFPTLDLLVLTHDHYDHLDYRTLRALQSRVRHFLTPLGVGAHLRHWGIPADRITELDWWQTWEPAPGISLTATPARHFSGRLFARGRTLWAAYVLQLHDFRAYLGGDSGYDDTFARVGQQFGPFDLALLEAGQYGDNWPYIHMLPEQTVQAARDLGAGVLLPVHWAKFKLSTHAWNDSIRRVHAHAATLAQPLTTPRIGQPVSFGGTLPTDVWWE